MTMCVCGQASRGGDEWCGVCGRRLDAGDRRQPETVTVAQVLLVLSAVLSGLGLLLTVYGAVVAFSLIGQLGQLGGLGELSAASSALGTDVSGRITGVLMAGVIETIVVVAVDVWAFRALGAARPVARHVLAGLAGVQAIITIAGMASLGAGGGLIAVSVLAGLLVFDGPVLILLWAPASSRRWFAGPTAAPTSGPPQNWAPEVPAPAPHPVASGPFPRPRAHASPPNGNDDPVTVAIALPPPASLPIPRTSGRHSAGAPQLQP